MTEILPALGLSAYLLGGRIAGQRKKQDRVPVAYLYNGVRLPGLPEEWNPVTHPFAWVRKTGALTNKYWLFLQTEITYTISSTSGAECISVTEDNCLQYVCKADGVVWESMEVGGPDVATGSWVKWANFNMLSTTGSLTIEASDPVPIYE